MISAPIILFPKTDWTSSLYVYYSASPTQQISGTIPVVASDLDIDTTLIVRYRYGVNTPASTGVWADTGMTVGTSTTLASEIPWGFDSQNIITYTTFDVINFEFKTLKIRNISNEVGQILEESSVSSLVANIVLEEDTKASANQPTGVKLKRFTDKIKLLIPESGLIFNKNNDFAGCNFYMSLDAGGGSGGYVRMNSILVTDTDESETEITVFNTSSYTDTANDLQVTTTKTRQVNNVFYTFTIDKAVLTSLISAGSIPNIFLSDGKTLREDITYYFITTVNTFDKTYNESIESPYSIELEAQFLRYNATFQNLPIRDRNDILFSMANDMMTNNDLISVVPGSVIRDVSEPLALQFEKFYVIQDFIFATESIDTLMLYDDANQDGVSDSLNSSSRKRALANALGVNDPINLQSLIDEQFDKQASNFNINRKDASKASGTVLFYSTIKPMQDIVIPDGTSMSTGVDLNLTVQSSTFVTSGTKIMDYNNADYYYNPSSKRYEIVVDIVASIAGSLGNVPAGVITTCTRVGPTIQVLNNEPTRYGSDKESNFDLAIRIKLARVSFDSGSGGGYTAVAYDTPGVLQARIQEAGDSLMMRDFDLDSKKHYGGKVDIYIKGKKNIQYVDQVSFKYEYPTDTFGNKIGEQFSIVNASDYRIKSINSKVTSDSPIVIVGSVRNVSKGKEYSLTDLQIVGSGDTLVLSKNFTNTTIGMSSFDVIEVRYLYRSSNELMLTNQPVESISEVRTTRGTLIDQSKYALIKLEDPLQNGRSTIAKDAVKFFFTESDNVNNINTVTDEQHDMLLNIPARLNFKGVDISSIVVTEVGGTLPYILNVDYTITSGSEIDYTYLNLLPNGKIRHGDRVSVDYESSENFNVTYVNNSVVDDVQVKIEKMKHADADALTKEAVANYADISFMVIRKTGVDKNILKSRLQTAVANYVSSLNMGDTFTQGALINTIRGVDGVKEIQMPITRMMKRTGSFIPLDDLGALNFEIFQKTSSSGVTAYRSVSSVLTYHTSENGGDPNLFRGVYEDNILLALTKTPGDVSKRPGRAYIQGDGRIIVSTTDSQPPHSKHYKAAYYTYYSADVNLVEDIETSGIEYIDVDSLSMRDIEIIDEKNNKRGI